MFKKKKENKVELNVKKDYNRALTPFEAMKRNFSIELKAVVKGPQTHSKTVKYAVYLLNLHEPRTQLELFDSKKEAEEYVEAESKRLVG